MENENNDFWNTLNICLCNLQKSVLLGKEGVVPEDMETRTFEGPQQLCISLMLGAVTCMSQIWAGFWTKSKTLFERLYFGGSYYFSTYSRNVLFI